MSICNIYTFSLLSSLTFSFVCAAQDKAINKDNHAPKSGQQLAPCTSNNSTTMSLKYLPIAMDAPSDLAYKALLKKMQAGIPY